MKDILAFPPVLTAIVCTLWMISSNNLAMAELGDSESKTDSPSYVMTEAEAVKLALKNSRKLESLDTSIDIQQNRLDSATSVDNPELRIKHLSTKYLTDSFDELAIGLRWNVPRLGELSLRKQSAMVRYREAQVDKAVAMLVLCRKVRKTYADIIYHQALVNIIENRIRIELQRIKQIEKMANIGRRSIVYFAKAKMWLEDAKSESAKISKRLMQSHHKLQRLTGMDAALILVSEDLPQIDCDEEQLTRIANENRSELDLFRERMLLAEKEHNMQRYKLIPWFSYIEADYHLEHRKDDWGEIMVGIELPLFNFNQGNIEATRLSIDRKQIKLDAVKEDLSNDLTRTIDIYREYLLEWKTGSDNARTIITTVNQIIEENKQHETIPIDEIIELERTVLATKQKQANRQHKLAHSLYDLYFSLGVQGYEELTGEAL